MMPNVNTPDNNTPDNNTPDNNTPDNNTPNVNTPDNNTATTPMRSAVEVAIGVSAAAIERSGSPRLSAHLCADCAGCDARAARSAARFARVDPCRCRVERISG